MSEVNKQVGKYEGQKANKVAKYHQNAEREAIQAVPLI